MWSSAGTRSPVVLDNLLVGSLLPRSLPILRRMVQLIDDANPLSGWTPSQRFLDSLTVDKVQLPMPHGMVQLSDIKYSTAPELLRGLH